MGVGCLYVARASRARSGRAITRNFPGRIPAGHGRRAEVLGDTGRNIPISGLAASPVRCSTPSPFSSPAMLLSASVLPGNIRRSWRAPRVSKCFHHWTWTAFRRLTTPRTFRLSGPLSEPQIEGSGVEPTPGSGAPVKAGEFILGHVDESGELVPLPEPEILSRNGTFMAYRRLQEHVGAFRDFCESMADQRPRARS